jgi:hypothetical protein
MSRITQGELQELLPSGSGPLVSGLLSREDTLPLARLVFSRALVEIRAGGCQVILCHHQLSTSVVHCGLGNEIVRPRGGVLVQRCRRLLGCSCIVQLRFRSDAGAQGVPTQVVRRLSSSTSPFCKWATASGDFDVMVMLVLVAGP